MSAPLLNLPAVHTEPADFDRSKGFWLGEYYMSDLYNSIMQILSEPCTYSECVLNPEALKMYQSDGQAFQTRTMIFTECIPEESPAIVESSVKNKWRGSWQGQINQIYFIWMGKYLRLILFRPVPNSIFQEADHKYLCRLQKQKLLVCNGASQLACTAWLRI